MSKIKNIKISGLIFLAISIIYMEVLVKLFTCNTFFDIGLLFMPIFSFAASFIIYGFSFLFKEKNRRWFTGGCISFLFVLFATQTVYHRFFNRYLILYSLTGGGIGQVLSGDIARNTFNAVLISTPLVLSLAVPVVITFVFYNKITVCKFPDKKWYTYFEKNRYKMYETDSVPIVNKKTGKFHIIFTQFSHNFHKTHRRG